MTYVLRRATMLAVPLSAALLLLFIALYGVNGPEWDHLSSADLFDRWDARTITADFLVQPHNEHRKMLPRLITLGLGLVTRFDTRVETVLHWLLLCSAVAILWTAFKADLARRDGMTPALWFAPIGLLMFSARPYEVLLGDGLLAYCALAGICGCIALLGTGGPSAVRFAGAIGCAIAATLSQSNGLLAWPLGVLILASRTRENTPHRHGLRSIATWAAAGAIAWSAYFYRYSDPGNHPSAREVLSTPAVAVEFFFTLCGSWLGPYRAMAILTGVVVTAGVVAACAKGIRLFRERQPLPAGLWLVVTALVTTIMITLNRASADLDPLLAPRYAIFTMLAPIGLYWSAAVRPHDSTIHRRMSRGAALVLVAGYLAGTIDAWSTAPAYCSKRRMQAYLLYTAKDQADALLSSIYPNPDHARRYAAILERLHLSVFADPPRAFPETPTGEKPMFMVDAVNDIPATEVRRLVLDGDDAVLIAGWALSSSGAHPAGGIAATVDGKVDLKGLVGLYRMDLGGRVRTRQRRWSGFVISFRAGVLSPGVHTVTLKIADPDKNRVYQTPVWFEIDRR